MWPRPEDLRDEVADLLAFAHHAVYDTGDKIRANRMHLLRRRRNPEHALDACEDWHIDIVMEPLVDATSTLEEVRYASKQSIDDILAGTSKPGHSIREPVTEVLRYRLGEEVRNSSPGRLDAIPHTGYDIRAGLLQPVNRIPEPIRKVLRYRLGEEWHDISIPDCGYTIPQSSNQVFASFLKPVYCVKEPVMEVLWNSLCKERLHISVPAVRYLTAQ